MNTHPKSLTECRPDPVLKRFLVELASRLHETKYIKHLESEYPRKPGSLKTQLKGPLQNITSKGLAFPSANSGTHQGAPRSIYNTVLVSSPNVSQSKLNYLFSFFYKKFSFFCAYPIHSKNKEKKFRIKRNVLFVTFVLKCYSI